MVKRSETCDGLSSPMQQLLYDQRAVFVCFIMEKTLTRAGYGQNMNFVSKLILGWLSTPHEWHSTQLTEITGEFRTCELIYDRFDYCRRYMALRDLSDEYWDHPYWGKYCDTDDEDSTNWGQYGYTYDEDST